MAKRFCQISSILAIFFLASCSQDNFMQTPEKAKEIKRQQEELQKSLEEGQQEQVTISDDYLPPPPDPTDDSIIPAIGPTITIPSGPVSTSQSTPTPTPTPTPGPDTTPIPDPESTPAPNLETAPVPTPEITPTSGPTTYPTPAPAITPVTSPGPIQATPTPTSTQITATPEPQTPTTPPPLHEESITENFVQQDQASDLDIVWVVDNSGSMSDNQEQLAHNFQLFIDNFVLNNNTFKMAVTSTDPMSRDLLPCFQSAQSSHAVCGYLENNYWGRTYIFQGRMFPSNRGTYYRLAADGLFINPLENLDSHLLSQDPLLFKIYFAGTDQDITRYQNECKNGCQNFRNKLLGIDYGYTRLGIHGSSNEQGLRAIYRSLERAIEQNNNPANAEWKNRNKNFFTRNESTWTIFIVLSDEDDNFQKPQANQQLMRVPVGYLTDPDENTFLGGVNKFMRELGRDVNKLRIHSIVNLSGENYNTANIGQPSIRYPQASERTHGRIYALNEYEDKAKGTVKEFGQILSNLADDLSVITNGYALRHRPKELAPQQYAIRVYVNGIQKTVNTHWYYDAANNTVLFTENNIPVIGAAIEIQYTALVP